MRKSKVTSWVKDHKRELVFVGIAVVGGCLLIFNCDRIRRVIESSAVSPETVQNIKPIDERRPKVFLDGIIEDLTGKKLTARELGNKVGCSAQTINKRLVEAGLAKRLPCGEYRMTETGQLLGRETSKITAAGHPFSNIEWDEKVLEII